LAKLLLKFNAAVIKEIPMTKGEMTIGRKPDNDIVIDNPAVSGHHARVVQTGGSYIIEDLNSTNGTFLRDQKILKAALHHKDEVAIAKHSIVFINEEEAASAPPPVPAVSLTPRSWSLRLPSKPKRRTRRKPPK
jgi:pSer/pThr/pTyr-binding forkhead associated (FHA) protein